MREIIKQTIIENINVRFLSKEEAKKTKWWFKVTDPTGIFTINLDIIAKEIEARIKKEVL